MQFFMNFALFLLAVFGAFASLNARADIYNREFTTPKELAEAKNNEIDHQKRKKYPNVKIGFIQELFFDSLIRSQPHGTSTNSGRGYSYTRGYFNFGLAENILLNSTLAMEPVSQHYNHPYGLTNYASGTNTIQSFSGEGLFVEELNLSYKNNNIEIFLGKFNPVFAAGAQRYSKIFDNDWYGISGTQTNFGYQLREKVGGRLDVTILNDREVFFDGFKKNKNKDDYENIDDNESEKPLFNQFLRLSLAGYKNDSSDLFLSTISNKNNAYYNNAAGRDSRFRSYSAAVDGYLRSPISKTTINLSSRAAYNNDIKMANESGHGYAAQHVFYLPSKIKLGGFAEYVKIDNFAGIKNSGQKYETYSVFASASGVSLSYVINKFRSSNGEQINGLYFVPQNQMYSEFLNDRFNSREVSIGYEFSSGVAIKMGRKHYYNIYRLNNQINNLEADQVSIRYRINY